MKAIVVRGSSVLVAVVLAGSCAPASGSAPGSTSGAASPTSVPIPSSSEVWVAVLDTAAEPDALSEGRAAVLAALGDALAGYVVVSPVSCMEGLPDRFPADKYLLAIQQAEQAEVQALAGALDRRPMFLGPVHVLCTD